MLADWPTVSLLLVGLFATYHGVRLLSLTFGWGMGALGTYWRTRRAISNAEADDMRRQIVALNGRVETLFWRDQCYFAYILADQAWHHRVELDAAARGLAVEPHQPFMEFRDRWMVDRGLDHELEIWKHAL